MTYGTHLSKDVASEWLVKLRTPVDELKQVHAVTMFFHHQLKEVGIFKTIDQLKTQLSTVQAFIFLFYTTHTYHEA